MMHCKPEECIPYGVFGSHRSKSECPHCIGAVVGQRVLFVCFCFYLLEESLFVWVLGWSEC